MNKEIDICVIGVHNIDGDKEEYVTKARGEYHFVNEKKYFRYEEETPYGKAKAMIKLSNDIIEVTKTGAVNMRLYLEKGKLVAGVYDTPYGSIPIDIDTKDIKIDEDEMSMKISVSYDMLNNDELLASCELIMEAKDI